MTTSSDQKKTIGWIGTGVMGASMAGHLQQAGHPLHVYTRSPDRARELIEQGAAWHDSPASLAAEVDILCLMVGTPDDLREVVLSDPGALSTFRGSLMIDFTTSSPQLAEEMAAAVKACGALALDAPVSGGDIGARNATLSIMVGGSPAAFESAKAILDCVGTTVVHQGPPGAGQHTKMVNQITVASSMIGICEALLYTRASGLDPETVLQSVGGGAASSWALINLWPRMLAEDYAPGFFVEHFIKDLGIALGECQRMGIELPGLALAHNLYRKLAESGHRRSGTQALILALDAIK
jgi:3-hydroxyisobutyrate dehydrogenase